MIRRSFCAALLLLAATASLARAQTDSVRGRLLGADGTPVPDERVVLHRVIGTSGGANIAETRSDTEGRFVIAVDSADNEEAVYFLAARWEGELYIGEAFRAPFGTAEHMLQVGVPGTSATALLEGTGDAQGMAPGPVPGAGGSPATRTSWLLFAVPLVALLGVALYFALRARGRIPPRRALLRELAELDLQYAGAPTDEYRATRAALIARLRDGA